MGDGHQLNANISLTGAYVNAKNWFGSCVNESTGTEREGEGEKKGNGLKKRRKKRKLERKKERKKENRKSCREISGKIEAPLWNEAEWAAGAGIPTIRENEQKKNRIKKEKKVGGRKKNLTKHKGKVISFKREHVYPPLPSPLPPRPLPLRKRRKGKKRLELLYAHIHDIIKAGAGLEKMRRNDIKYAWLKWKTASGARDLNERCWHASTQVDIKSQKPRKKNKKPKN